MSPDTGNNLEALSAIPAPRQHYCAGTFIYLAGEPGHTAYVIESGEVEMLTTHSDGTPHLTRLGPGELFGDMEAIDHLPRSSSACASRDTVLLLVDAIHINDLLESANPVTQYIVHSLTRRLRKHSDASGVIAHPTKMAHLSPGGHLHTRMLRTLTVIADLEHAIETHALELHYQPLIHLRQRSIAGFEALLRWKPTSLGQVGPEEFVAIAEQSGLIYQLGTWMLHRATREWAVLRTSCPPVAKQRHPFLCLNFSAPELSQTGIKDVLEWCLKERNIPGNELHLELTERMLPLRNHAPQPEFSITDTMQQVRNLGINLALDDMGTGYSGLETLMNLPFSAIKIDKSFVQNITRCPRTAKIVRAMLTLAKALGLHSTAEGIEDEATHQMLVQMGCTYGQGYYYAHPMSKADTIQWARDYSPLTG